MILVTGVASVSDQRLLVAVRRRTQPVAQSLVAGILRRMFTSRILEIGILGTMTVTTSRARVCGMSRMAIPAVACYLLCVLVIPVAERALRIHRRGSHRVTACAFR